MSVPRVFISHSSLDRVFVDNHLTPLLKRHSIDYWYSKANISTAEEWEVCIRQGLKSCDWFLIILSEVSVKSDWVRAELQWAIQNRKSKIIPLLLRDCDQDDIPIRLLTLQYIDFRTDIETASWDLLRIWGSDFLPVSNKLEVKSVSSFYTDLELQEADGLIFPESQIGLADLTLTEQLYLLCADDDMNFDWQPYWAKFGVPVMAIYELLIAKKVSLNIENEGTEFPQVLLTVIDKRPVTNPILGAALGHLISKAAGKSFNVACNDLREIFGYKGWNIVADHLVTRRFLANTVKKKFFGFINIPKYSMQAIERRHEARLKFCSLLTSHNPLSLNISSLSLVAYECQRLPFTFLSKPSEQQVKSVIDRASKYALAQLIAKTVEIAIRHTWKYRDEGLPAGAS